MNIISEKAEVSLLIDGINTILKLPEEQFHLLIQQMKPNGKIIDEIRFHYVTDECRYPDNPIQLGLEQTHNEDGKYIARYYWGSIYYSTQQILEECEKMLNNYSIDSVEYTKINQILETRDLSSFKSYYCTENNINPLLLDKLFEILSNDDSLSNFLDYSNNIETFAIDGKEISMSEYLKHLGEIFGNLDNNGELSADNHISSDFFISNLDELKKRCLPIYKIINMERYVNPNYTFLMTAMLNKVIRKGEEPEWKIASETYEAIFADMPQNLSLEEQAIYIYCKMCLIFDYDEGYLYRNRLDKVNYESTFSKDHLESLIPGDRITCFDFSRLYAKLVNELEGDIEAVMILYGTNEGHAIAGFYTDRVSVTVDAINIHSKQDATNDLTKAKYGINLRGIKIISDKDAIIKKSIDKVYPYVLDEKPKTMEEWIQELRNTTQEQDIPNDVALKLQSLMENMKKNQVFGNELTQTLWRVLQTKYFGENELEKAYFGELKKDDYGNESYKRYILLRMKKCDSYDKSLKEVYLIDTETLDFIMCSEQDVIKKLNSGELIYENPDRKLDGIDKEEKE